MAKTDVERQAQYRAENLELVRRRDRRRKRREAAARKFGDFAFINREPTDTETLEEQSP